MQINDTRKSRKGSIAVALVCLVLQVMFASNVGMENGSINFALVFAGVYALGTGGKQAVVWGFVAGLVFDLLTTGPMGLMAALLTVFSFALGSEARNRFADGFVTALSAYGVGAMGVCLAYNLTMLLLGTSASIVEILFLRTLPTFALSFVAFLPFAYVQMRSGTKGGFLRPFGKSSSLGSHYDMRDL